MGEEEENNNNNTNTNMISRTQSSLELLCNTAAWKNAVEKTWTSTSPSVSTTPAAAAAADATTGKQQHPTEVLIMPQHQLVGTSLPASSSSTNIFARSTSTLSLVGQGGGSGGGANGGGGGGDASSVNHVTTASSVSSFDDSSSNYYSSSPLSTASSVVVHPAVAATNTSSADAAAAAYRAAMMGLPLRLLGVPTMNHQGHATAAVAAASSSSLLRQPVMISATSVGGAAPFSSTTTSTASVFPQGRSPTPMPPLSLPTLSGSSSNNTKAVPTMFHLEKTAQGRKNSKATAGDLLPEANSILLSANNKSPSPSPPQVAGASSYPQPMMTEKQPSAPQEEQEQAPVVTKNKKKMVALMAQENKALKEKVSLKDKEILKLRKEMAELKNQIQELRQLPTGKISQIPVEDMIEMMQLYGSEVSDSVMPIRQNQNIQKASIVRQFRRWNPNFLEHFHHVHGKWVPKLGRDGELKRREQARLERRKSGGCGDSSNGSVVSAGAVSTATSSSSTKNKKFNINTMGSTATAVTNHAKIARKKMKKSSP